MTTLGLILLTAAIIFGFYMAWNIGANDVANAMGTSVGSKSITIRQAVIIAAIFEFLGASLAGGSVTNTIRKGMFDPQLFAENPMQLAVGMLAALIAAAAWLQISSLRGHPVSTTHSIVGAVIGFAVISQGVGAVSWGKILTIVASWFVSPVTGGLVAFLTFKGIRRLLWDVEHPIRAAKTRMPWLTAIFAFVMALVIVYKGLKNLKLGLSFVEASAAASLVGLIGFMWGKRLVASLDFRENQPHRNQCRQLERRFIGLQVVTAALMAFAHGSNDVANAVGPLAGIVAIIKANAVAMKSAVPLWVLLLGGVGIVVGLATYGKKVMATVGKEITSITPSRGFAAEFGAAITIVVGSQLGLPLSTTHILVGAVIGVGFARGFSALNLDIVRNVATSWLLTVPAAAVVSALLYSILNLILGTYL